MFHFIHKLREIIARIVTITRSLQNWQDSYTLGLQIKIFGLPYPHRFASRGEIWHSRLYLWYTLHIKFHLDQCIVLCLWVRNLKFDRFWDIRGAPIPVPFTNPGIIWHTRVIMWNASPCQISLHLVTPAGRETAHLTKFWIFRGSQTHPPLQQLGPNLAWQSEPVKVWWLFYVKFYHHWWILLPLWDENLKHRHLDSWVICILAFALWAIVCVWNLNASLQCDS